MLMQVLFGLSLYGQTPAPAPPAASQWTGSVGLGLISITGNATAVTLTANGLAQFKTPDWIYGLKASAIYGESKPPTNDPNASSQVLALAASLQLRLDRRLTQTISAYLLGGAETDHVKSVEFRGIAEAGVGLVWIDVKEGDLSKTMLRTDVAFRYANESRFQYYPTPQSLPGATLYAPKVGVAFRYAFSKDIVFIEEAEALANVGGDSRFVVNNLSKLNTRLIQSLALAVGFTVNYDSAPAPSRKSTDTALSVGLEYQI
jgi:putative salt-induced outer membrane protein YdiY